MKWNTIVNEVNRDKIVNCDYLEKLKDSINQYNQTVYSPIYKERFLNLFFALPLGISYPFVRIGCTRFCDFICVKYFFNMHDFDEEVRRNNERRYCTILHDQDTFSYYGGDDRLNVVLWGKYHSVHLLHKSEEEKKMYLPNGVVVKVENIEESFMVSDFIMLYLTHKN